MMACGRGAYALNRGAPERSPMPLHFSDEEKDLLLSLAQPIEQKQRGAFPAAVAAALELEAGGQAGAVGIGAVHRVARTVQRRFWDPPQLPNASKVARA
jgi:hypothetical protein